MSIAAQYVPDMRQVQAGQPVVIVFRRTCTPGTSSRHGRLTCALLKPHALGIITFVVLGVAAVAGYTRLYGRASPYIETVSYSATFLFNMIPGITETTTRLPLGAPLLPDADAPALKTATAVLVVVFLTGAAFQVRRIRARLRRAA
ncbi:MAG TPA: hypothetical protein VGQ19_07410 [Burkholderiales bacterium]|nr:hypothetical protein [Burkholderiales bacterium]